MHSVWPASYLRLTEQAVLKRLEKKFVYHTGKDELYEIDGRAEDFLMSCDGTRRGKELTSEGSFVAYCLEEGLLELLAEPAPRNVTVNEPMDPSLRYLELQLLHRCNLSCLHCYLGASSSGDMPLKDALAIVREFSALGGLRLLISGGEPLLYGELRALIAQTAGLGLRRVLLSNGTLITARNIGWLNLEEIQFSLDGWQEGHDMLRGVGAFERTMGGIGLAKEAGIAVSLATMIHRGNLEEFEQMRRFAEQVGAVEWGIDLPLTAGELGENRHLLVPYAEAAPLMEYGFGGGCHGSADGYACGRNLLTVTPSGKAVKCGFYSEKPLGDARRGLKDCWLNLEHTPLNRLECRGCAFLEECRGGCRFRAPHALAPDPFMCVLYGINNRMDGLA